MELDVEKCSCPPPCHIDPGSCLVESTNFRQLYYIVIKLPASSQPQRRNDAEDPRPRAFRTRVFRRAPSTPSLVLRVLLLRFSAHRLGARVLRCPPVARRRPYLHCPSLFAGPASISCSQAHSACWLSHVALD